MFSTLASGSTLVESQTRGAGEIDAAKLHALQQFDIGAEGGVRELLDRDATARTFGDFIGEGGGSGADLRANGRM